MFLRNICTNLSNVIKSYQLRMFNILKKGGKMLAKTFKKLASTLTVVVALFSSLAIPQTAI